MCLCLLHAIPDGDKLSIEILQPSPNRLPDRLLNLLLHHARRNTFKSLVPELVFCITNAKLERIDLDVHVFDFEYGAAILVGRHKMNDHRQALSTKNDVRQSRVPQLDESSLLAEIDGNVPHVRLYLRECDSELVVPYVFNSIVRAKLEEVVRLHGHDIGEHVPSLKCDILDDKVKLIVGILDTWNRYISDLRVILNLLH